MLACVFACVQRGGGAVGVGLLILVDERQLLHGEFGPNLNTI